MKMILFFSILFSLSNSNVLAFDQSHSELNQILEEHVKWEGKQSLFNYRKLKLKPGKLKLYLKELSGVKEAEFKLWTSEQRLAFLINAYNAFTIKLILDNYPLNSIKDISGLFTSAWKKKFFFLFGEKTHLDHIEHDLIRGKFNEPRIHFAVVCASIGCPSIQDKAFTDKNLESLLNKSARTFLTDPSKNKIADKLYLSKIFKWYGGDFVKKYGSIEKYIAPIISNSAATISRIRAKSFHVDFTKYDWKLNEWK